MAREIKIGRLGNQKLKIDDPAVSGNHAVLIIDDNGSMSLVDTESSNGTFIYNGNNFVALKPKKKYPVTADTFVRFGPYSQCHVRSLIPEEPRYDIHPLKILHENYNRRKLEIQADQQGIQGFRSSTIFIMALVTAVGGFAGDSFTNVPKGLIWGISFAIGILIFFVIQMVIKNKLKAKMEENQQNEVYYSKHYVCPKCSHSFKGSYYENILATGKCPRCKSKFYDSELEGNYQQNQFGGFGPQQGGFPPQGGFGPQQGGFPPQGGFGQQGF